MRQRSRLIPRMQPRTSIAIGGGTGATVGKVTVATGASVTLATGQGAALNIAVNATRVFWANDTGSTGTIMTVPINGGTATPVVSADNPYYVTADAANVYWTSFVNAAVSQVAISGGAPVPLGSSNVSGIAVDATSVYWAVPIGSPADNAGVMKAPIGGGGPAVQVTSTPVAPLYLTVDATNAPCSHHAVRSASPPPPGQ